MTEIDGRSLICFKLCRAEVVLGSSFIRSFELSCVLLRDPAALLLSVARSSHRIQTDLMRIDTRGRSFGLMS
jgi:hypothetical protein